VLLPALFRPDPNWPEVARSVFNAISRPVEALSRLVRHPRLAEHEMADIRSHARRFLHDLGPLSSIVDRHRHESVLIPAETWDCAHVIRQTVWPLRGFLEHYISDQYEVELGWEVESKLERHKRAAKSFNKRSLETFRKRVIDRLRKRDLGRVLSRLTEFARDFADERLMRDLHKAIARDFAPSRKLGPRRSTRPGGRHHTNKPTESAARNAKAVSAAHPRPKSKGGRKPSADTVKKNRLCHEAYSRVEAGVWKMAMAISDVERRLGADVFGDGSTIENKKSHLRTCARRYRDSSAFQGGEQN
jgi:hypothetical protein